MKKQWRRPAGAGGMLAIAALSLVAMQVRADEAADRKREQAQQQLKEAQQQLEQDAQRVAELSMAASEDGRRIERRVVIRRMGHAQLGVMIDDTGGAGVHVKAVTPGSPAEAAGLRADDTIVSLGGTSLVGEGGERGTRRLMDLLGDAKVGEPLAIEVKRGGQLVKAQVVPRRAEGVELLAGDDNLPLVAALHDGHGPEGFVGLQGLEGLPLLLGGHTGLGAMQLAELSPGLGSYFGVDKGLLVVRAPADERYKLQDGDVLLDIDGRVPTGVSHALQILASYRPGESARLHLMRQKKRIELAVQVPSG